MGVSSVMKPGMTDKNRVKILTVDPTTRRIEAALKDGSMIQVAVWDMPNAFRWPKENEIWIVWRQNGIWMLGSRAQVGEVTTAGDGTVTTEPEPFPIDVMQPGQMKLDATEIFDAQGRPIGGPPPLNILVSIYMPNAPFLHGLGGPAGSLALAGLGNGAFATAWGITLVSLPFTQSSGNFVQGGITAVGPAILPPGQLSVYDYELTVTNLAGTQVLTCGPALPLSAFGPPYAELVDFGTIRHSVGTHLSSNGSGDISILSASDVYMAQAAFTVSWQPA